MNNTDDKAYITFYSVAKPHKYEDPPKELLCEACEEVSEYPVSTFTCKHRLCVACWQKSSYNYRGLTNACLICNTPTELVCYLNYWKFIGKNILQGTMWIEQADRRKLDHTVMYCSVDGCKFKAKRPEVINHEKACWNNHRRKMAQNEEDLKRSRTF